MIAALRLVAGLLFVAATSGVVTQAANAQSVETPAGAEINQLRGDLYTARMGSQYTVFLVTADGVIVGDPIDYLFARWLREELAARFPGRPVRYVVFSHHHFDRADGGSVFPNARFVAQNNFNDELNDARRTLPALRDISDANNNGRFDSDELSGRSGAASIAAHDRNADGSVTKDEAYAFVPLATERFETSRTITLGGAQVQAIHTGDWHSPDMAALFFPEQRTVFAVEPPPITMVPFLFGAARAGQVYAWLAAIVPLDFDTLLMSDGQVISRAQVLDLANYLDALREDVTNQYERGRSLAAILATRIPEGQEASPHYAMRRSQIEALYRTLRFRSLEFEAIGTANYGSRDDAYCSSYTTCTGGGVVGAGTIGVSYMYSRRTGVGLEVLLGEQSWSTRSGARYSEETALRQLRGAALFRVAPVRSIAFVAGPSVTFSDARGVAIQQGSVPYGGRRQLHQRVSPFGITGGVDLMFPLTGRMDIAAPVRINVVTRELPIYWPGRIAATAGVGFKIRLARDTR